LLRYEAGTSEIGRAELEDRARFAELLDAEVPSGWPPPLNDKGSMTWFTEYLEANPDAVGWVAWYFLLNTPTRKSIAIGNGGFKGKPDATGTVEVGYSILEEYHRKGFASEAVGALIHWAFSHENVTRIIAHTFPDLQPSIRVLEKCGFACVGKGTEEGTVRFQLLREGWSQVAQPVVRPDN
jgi:RimJ/RimL family protein N-acetyltransferase